MLGTLGLFVKTVVEGIRWLGVKNETQTKAVVVALAAIFTYVYGVDIFGMVGLKAVITNPFLTQLTKAANVLVVAAATFGAHDLMAKLEPKAP